MERDQKLELIQKAATLEDLNDAGTWLHVTPGWSDRALPIFRHMERSAYQPAHWRYEEMREALDVASGLIDIEMAERRNLVLCNPRPGDDWATTQTLVCAFQMIQPGESARSHRHSSNAMRVIIDGAGTYSTVAGEKVPMESGDVVLTPGGFYHGHGHEGDEPAYWFDCLDVPLTRLLETNFHNGHPDGFEPITRVAPQSPFRFSSADISRALDAAQPARNGQRGPHVALEAKEMPSFGLLAQRISGGTSTRRWRSSPNRIFSVMSGSGVSKVEGRTFAWERGDAFIVPAKCWLEHKADVDAQLLEITDEPLLRFANHYAEEFE